MIDINTINEEINHLLEEGDIEISKKFRKKIIKCISLYNISEEKLGQVLERIIDNSTIYSEEKNYDPKKKDIKRIINDYIDEYNYDEDFLNTTNQYIDNDRNEQMYNGFNKNKYQNQKFKDTINIKPKIKHLKITYKNKQLHTEE